MWLSRRRLSRIHQFRTAEFLFVFEGEDTTVSFEFPSLEASEFSGIWSFPTPVGGGDLAVVSRNSPNGLYIVRAGMSEPELLYDGDIYTISLDDGDLYAWEHSDPQNGLKRLIRIPQGSTEAEIIIEGVDSTLAVDDGRWLSVSTPGDENSGELKMFDSAMGNVEVIDRDVVGTLYHYNPLGVPAMGTLVIPSDAPFLYSVWDDSERNGLWRSTLASR